MKVLDPTHHREIFIPYTINNNKECYYYLCKDPTDVQLKKRELVHIKSLNPDDQADKVYIQDICQKM